MGLKQLMINGLRDVIMTPGWTCKGIITHRGGHPDERVAIFLFKRFADKVFPGKGIGDAPIQYKDTSRFTPDGRLARAWEADGFLLPGIWYSSLDEHGIPAKQRIYTCAATMTAELLGMRWNEDIAIILELTLANDREGGSKHWDFPTLLHEMYMSGIPEETIMETSFRLLDAKYQGQVQYLAAVNEIAVKPPKLLHIAGADGTVYHVVVSESDNPYMHRALNLNRELTTPEGEQFTSTHILCYQCPEPVPGRDGKAKTRHFRPDGVLNRSSKGATLFCQDYMYSTARYIVACWREAEAKLRGVTVMKPNLGRDGTLKDLPGIHFQEEAARAFFGPSLRNLNAPGTSVPPKLQEQFLYEAYQQRNASLDTSEIAERKERKLARMSDSDRTRFIEREASKKSRRTSRSTFRSSRADKARAVPAASA